MLTSRHRLAASLLAAGVTVAVLAGGGGTSLGTFQRLDQEGSTSGDDVFVASDGSGSRAAVLGRGMPRPDDRTVRVLKPVLAAVALLAIAYGLSSWWGASASGGRSSRAVIALEAAPRGPPALAV
jgi:hypothetical protein